MDFMLSRTYKACPLLIEQTPLRLEHNNQNFNRPFLVPGQHNKNVSQQPFQKQKSPHREERPR